MKKLSLVFFALSLVAQLPAQTPKPKSVTAPKSATPKPSALDKTVLANYVRHLQAWDQSINIEIANPKPAPMDGFYEMNIHASKDKASQDLVYYVSKDGSRIIQGTVFETAENPFKSDLDKLKGITTFAPNYGTAGAPVVIVEFSDFECPFCKEEAKTLRANLLKTYPKEVHLYHLDYPLEAVHPWARAAALAGHCIFHQNTTVFWDYYDWIYDHQADINPENLKAKVLEWAKGNDKIDSLQLTRCLDNKELDKEIAESMEHAKDLGVNQTPMFFVNGRRMAGAIEWPTLKHVIDEEIEYQKTAKNAGEDCGCSVTLPSPGTQTTPTLGGLK
jgi:protein-disulfide isomerase